MKKLRKKPPLWFFDTQRSLRSIKKYGVPKIFDMRRGDVIIIAMFDRHRKKAKMAIAVINRTTKTVAHLAGIIE